MTKPTKLPVRPAKLTSAWASAQSEVWSESSLSALWVAKDLCFLHKDREDSDQCGRTGYFVGLVMLGLISKVSYVIRKPIFIAVRPGKIQSQ